MDTPVNVENMTSGFSMDNFSGYISLAITIIAAFFILSGILFGLKRGFSRTVVRLLTVALSAVGAYFIAASLSGIISGYAEGLTLMELVDKGIIFAAQVSGGLVIAIPDEIRNLISSFDAEISIYLVRLIVSLLLVPFVFVAVFLIFKLVSMIIYWIITAVAGLRKRRTKTASRLVGALVGAVQGALIAAVLLLPLSGFSTIVTECRALLTAETVNEEKRAHNEEFFVYWLDDITSNPVLNIVGNIGGNSLFNNMTAIPAENEKVPLSTPVKTFASIYSELDTLGAIDPMAPAPESQAALEGAVDVIGDDAYTATILAGLMRGVNNAVDNGALVIVAEEPMGSFIGSIVDVFQDSSKDNLEGDLDTILHVYFILANNGVLSSFDNADNLRTALISKHEDGKTVIDYVVDELYLNPRTAHIVNSLTELSIKIMCESMGLSDDAQAVYQNVKGGVNEILAMNEADYATRDEYLDAVSVSLDTTLKANNINLDEGTLDTMSNYIADNYSDVSEITDEDINRALLSYYGAYTDSGELPGDIPVTPPAE